MKYRSDIDGLRAVAVVPVLLLHAGFTKVAGLPIAPGGYVGVDIFFVISGFLVSKIIYDEISGGTYNIAQFYVRRVRRLFPSIYVVYLFCIAASIFLSIGNDAAEIRNGILSSIFFVSNWYFSTKAGYFDSATQLNPLLHTWSLSIEEQFYVIFPILLLAILKLPHRGRLLTIFLFTIASLAYSEYLVRHDPDVGYYSTLARAWELSLGALLALSSPPRLSRGLAELVGALGLAAIAGTVMLYDKNTPFPGLMALPPCLGAAAILWSGMSPGTTVARLLSLPPIRFTGLISYSLYVWHWPLLVFAQMTNKLSHAQAAGILVACYSISALSWRFVEQPVRTMKMPAKRIVPLGAAAAAMAVAAVLAVLTVPLNGLVWPASEQTRRLVAFLDYDVAPSMREGTCFLTTAFDDISLFREDTCLQPARDKPNMLLLGDSHAAQYWSAISQAEPGFNVMQATVSGCLPVFASGGPERCRLLWDKVVGDFLPKNHVDAIVLAGRWTVASVPDAVETARRLRQYSDKVYVIGPNVEFTYSLPRLLIKGQAGDAGDIVASHSIGKPAAADQALKAAFAGQEGIEYLSFFDAVCKPDCPVYASNGDPLLFDDNHLTLAAARDVAGALASRLQ